MKLSRLVKTALLAGAASLTLGGCMVSAQPAGRVTYSYRDVANRHRAKAAAYAARHAGAEHGGH